jgi:thioredoxin-like negative regulator of GroEL
MKPEYSAAAKDMKAFLPGAYLAAVDATVQQGLAKRFELKGYPTLKYFEGGKFNSDYNGGRTKSEIISFMRDGPAKTEL